MVKDRQGKSKSYAFIVYERERDMKGESSRFAALLPFYNIVMKRASAEG